MKIRKPGARGKRRRSKREAAETLKKSDVLEAERLENLEENLEGNLEGNLEENLEENLMEETPPPDGFMEGGEADFGFVHMIMAQ